MGSSYKNGPFSNLYFSILTAKLARLVEIVEIVEMEVELEGQKLSHNVR